LFIKKRVLQFAVGAVLILRNHCFADFCDFWRMKSISGTKSFICYTWVIIWLAHHPTLPMWLRNTWTASYLFHTICFLLSTKGTKRKYIMEWKYGLKSVTQKVPSDAHRSLKHDVALSAFNGKQPRTQHTRKRG